MPEDEHQELEPAAVAAAGADEGDSAPEPAPSDRVEAPAAATAPALGVAYNERTFTAGMTQSGKSELLNHQFSVIRCQRLLIDTKREFLIDGVEAVEGDPGGLDWRQPVLHYIPGDSSRDETEALFSACYARRYLVVAAHELADLCNFHPSATPPAVRSYLNKGQGLGLGLLGGSQLPVMVPTHARTEAAHVFIFVPALDPEHHKALASTIGLDHRELAAVLEQLQAKHGQYSFLWWNRRTRELVECPPLPERVRARSIVRRRPIGST